MDRTESGIDRLGTGLAVATMQWIEGLLAENSAERAGGRADGRVELEIKRRLVDALASGSRCLITFS